REGRPQREGEGRQRVEQKDEGPITASTIVQVDSRTKAGAFGEKIRGPHKPTLDEMGPHASLSVPSARAGLPQKPDLKTTPKPTRTIDVPSDDDKKSRRGRARKTGRPGM
ncbi:MAG: excinuclease ABC subunit UvrB, partial [Hyphomicrobiaceae bacterium]